MTKATELQKARRWCAAQFKARFNKAVRENGGHEPDLRPSH